MSNRGIAKAMGMASPIFASKQAGA